MRNTNSVNYILFVVVIGLLAYLILRKEPTLIVESLKRQNDSLMTEATKRNSLIAARLASIDRLEKVKPIILKVFITETLSISNVQDSLFHRNFICQQKQRLGPTRFDYGISDEGTENHIDAAYRTRSQTT